MPQTAIYTDSETKKFIVFAKEFAANTETLEEGFYQDDDEEFNLSLQATINRLTPARVNRQTGLFQVSKTQFDSFTPSMRMFILLHEWFHFKLNSKSELEVDLEALRLFLALGFAPQEAINSMTKVFKTKSEANTLRINKLKEYIHFFNQK